MRAKSGLLLPAAAVIAIAVAACGGSSQSNTDTGNHKSTYSEAQGSGSSPQSGQRNRSGSKTGTAAIRLRKIAISHNGSSVKQMALVNANGRPVYLLTGDSRTHPLCTSASCLTAWPAVTVTSTTTKLGTGIHAKLTIWSHNGMHQLVLAGHPLYLFAGDGGNGVANGDGVKSFGGTWWVLGANGAIAKASTAASGSGGGSGSSGGW